jgi:hypothetical protein
VAGVRFERKARLGLSKSGLPVAYPAKVAGSMEQGARSKTPSSYSRFVLLAPRFVVPPEGFAPSPFHGLNVTTLLVGLQGRSQNQSGLSALDEI